MIINQQNVMLLMLSVTLLRYCYVLHSFRSTGVTWEVTMGVLNAKYGAAGARSGMCGIPALRYKLIPGLELIF